MSTDITTLTPETSQLWLDVYPHDQERDPRLERVLEHARNLEIQRNEARALLPPKINIRCELHCGDLIGTTDLNVVRVEQEEDGSFTAITDYWPRP